MVSSSVSVQWSYVNGQLRYTDKRTDVWSRPLCTYSGIFSPKKKLVFLKKKILPKKTTFFFYLFSMQLFSADATMFSKFIFSFFCPQKVEKPPSKVAQKNSKPLFFHYCPELPKRPKQKYSCSKLWLIDQLYLELGFPHFKISNW